MDNSEAHGPDPPVAPQRHGVKLLFIAMAALLLLGTGVFFVRTINKPATGTIGTPETPQPPSNAPITVIGKTVTFQYSSLLQRVTPDKLTTGDVEKFLFIEPQSTGWTLAIRVKNLPSGSLANDGDYNLRKQNPQQYTEEKQTINSMTISIMSDQSGTHNKVAFIPHGTLLAELALSGSPGDATSQQLFNDILQSWRWR